MKSISSSIIYKNKSSFWFACAVNLLLLIFYFSAMETAFETNDDINIAMAVNLGQGVQDITMLFGNVILGSILSFLYRVTNMIPWYGLTQIAMIWLAMASVTYVFMNMFEGWTGLVISLILVNSFGVDGYMLLQFTKTAGLCSAAGIFLIFWCMSRKRMNVKGISLGVAIAIYGYMQRSKEFKAVLVVIMVYGLYLLLKVFQSPNWSIREKARRVAKYFLTLAVLLSMVTVVQGFSDYIVDSDNTAREYREYNYLRSQIYDYGFPDFDENRDLYDRLGITEEAYILYSNYNFYDPEYFTIDVMRELVSHVTNHKRSSFSTLKEFFTVYPLRWTYDNFYFFLLMFIGLALIYGDRKKITYFTFSIAVILQFILYYYLFLLGRFNIHRVDVPIYFAFCLVMVSLADRQKLRWRRRDGLFVTLSVLALCQTEWKDSYKDSMYIKFYDRIMISNTIAEVSHDTVHLYLAKHGAYSFYRAYGPLDLVPIGAVANTASLGGFEVMSKNYLAILSSYGVTNPYRDMIGSDVIYVVDNNIDLTLTYLRQYYDPTVYAEEAGEIAANTAGKSYSYTYYRIVAGDSGG